MAFPDYLEKTEASIIGRIIKTALARGYTVSVGDDVEWFIRRSTDFDKISSEVAATDFTYLSFFSANREDHIGVIFLVHGNGSDVVSDHSDNELTASLVEAARDLIEQE